MAHSFAASAKSLINSFQACATGLCRGVREGFMVGKQFGRNAIETLGTIPGGFVAVTTAPLWGLALPVIMGPVRALQATARSLKVSAPAMR